MRRYEGMSLRARAAIDDYHGRNLAPGASRSDARRDVLSMIRARRLAGMSYGEIAAAFGLSRGAVFGLVQRDLRDKL